LRYPGGETYPSAAVVARFRELGGERVVVGSDAHSRGSFAARLDESYRHLAAAGFEGLTFRRGGEPVRIQVPRTAPHGTVMSLPT
jgi:histidinol-phosphatase (PHP family)